MDRHADRPAWAGRVRGGRCARGASPLSDPLSQSAGGAGEHRSGHGGGGREPRCRRVDPIPPHHAAAGPPGTLCRRHHRLHLELHRTRHTVDARVQPRDAGADLQWDQGDGGVRAAVRADRGPALHRDDPLSLRQGRLRPRGGSRERQGVDSGEHPSPRRLEGRGRRAVGGDGDRDLRAAARRCDPFEPRSRGNLVPQRPPAGVDARAFR